ncbi:MAG: ABC transporter ATP-binding protein [Anaerolineales bacterium]|jgi:putative ABC transport system ATP-binding protein
MRVPAFIELDRVSKSYPQAKDERRVLSDLSLQLAQGELVAVRGRSGSGKTTLLNLLAGIDLPDCGTVTLQGKVINHLSERDRTIFRRDHIGFVFQFFNLIPTLSVLENVLLPIEIAGRDGRESLSHAHDLLERVGLGDRTREFPDRLSGGEQQRVAVARALIHTPGLVLADEPTGNLDRATGEDVMRLLTGLTRGLGGTLILVTHSRWIAGMADRRLTLREGQIAPDIDLLEASGGLASV